MSGDEIPLLVLAGGFGTRLRSVVSDVPKTLAPIDGKPFLEYLLRFWIQQGVRNFTFLLHFESEKIIHYLNLFIKNNPNDLTIDWVIEVNPLGTGGSVANAVQRKNLAGNFLVTNSDTWLSGGITEISSCRAPAMAVVEVENSNRYGQVRLSGEHIENFIEKAKSSGKGWVNAGLYKLDSEDFKSWRGESFNLENGLFPMLAIERRLIACPIKVDFIDIGIPEDYLKFQKLIAQQKL